MDNLSPELATALLNYATFLLIVAGIAVWLSVLRRVRYGRPIVPFSYRRQVPWNGLDAIGILLAYLCVTVLLMQAANYFMSWQPSAPQNPVTPQQQHGTAQQAHPEAPVDEAIDIERAHPIVVLLSDDSSIGTLVLCVLAVVVMAPISEEFFFRLVLQGCFEKMDFECRGVLRYPGRLVGVWPIALTSLLFAALHARDPHAPLPAEELTRLFIIDTLAKAVVVAGAIAYLKEFRAATWEDLGFRLDSLGTDAKLALATFLAVFLPIVAAQAALASWFPEMVPDPLPLFFLAIALGYLYFRTHRLTPAILLHMLFNGSALILFFASRAAGQQ